MQGFVKREDSIASSKVHLQAHAKGKKQVAKMLNKFRAKKGEALGKTDEQDEEFETEEEEEEKEQVKSEVVADEASTV